MTLEGTAPAVRVISGDPTEEEIAAVVAVVSEHYAQEAAQTVVDERPADRWGAPRPRRLPHGTWGRFAG